MVFIIKVGLFILMNGDNYKLFIYIKLKVINILIFVYFD